MFVNCLADEYGTFAALAAVAVFKGPWCKGVNCTSGQAVEGGPETVGLRGGGGLGQDTSFRNLKTKLSPCHWH